MRYTLLEMTQRILESMESDEVNSYSDTVESLAVANIIKECFWEITSTLDLPEHFGMFELEASGDSSKPTLMTRPSDVISLSWIKYDWIDTGDTDSQYKDIGWCNVKTFMDMQLGFDTDETNVGTFNITNDGDTIPIKYYNDRFPQFWTSYDDSTILFDAYKSTVDTTLVKNKTLCYGQLQPTFTMSDTFTPDLDPRQFQLLLNQAKAQAFFELKQQENKDANMKSRRHRISTQKKKHDVPFPKSYRDQLPNYGRKVR